MLDEPKYGPWALIAGGSDGLGAAYAQHIAASGINLVLVARRPGPLAETAAAVRADYGVEVRTATADITAPDLIDQLRPITDDIEIGLLICNAGGAGSPKPFLDRPVDYSLRLVEFTVMAQMRLAYHFGGKMVARGRGSVLLMSAATLLPALARRLGHSSTSTKGILPAALMRAMPSSVKRSTSGSSICPSLPMVAE